MEISYYELLGMIKDGNIPEKIKVKCPTLSYSKTYYASYDGENFSNYFLLEDDDEKKYEVYLANFFLESDMFKKCITILDEENNTLNIDEAKEEIMTILDKCNELTYQDKQYIMNNINYVFDKTKKE